MRIVEAKRQQPPASLVLQLNQACVEPVALVIFGGSAPQTGRWHLLATSSLSYLDGASLPDDRRAVRLIYRRHPLDGNSPHGPKWTATRLRGMTVATWRVLLSRPFLTANEHGFLSSGTSVRREEFFEDKQSSLRRCLVACPTGLGG